MVGGTGGTANPGSQTVQTVNAGGVAPAQNTGNVQPAADRQGLPTPAAANSNTVNSADAQKPCGQKPNGDGIKGFFKRHNPKSESAKDVVAKVGLVGQGVARLPNAIAKAAVDADGLGKGAPALGEFGAQGGVAIFGLMQVPKMKQDAEAAEAQNKILSNQDTRKGAQEFHEAKREIKKLDTEITKQKSEINKLASQVQEKHDTIEELRGKISKTEDRIQEVKADKKAAAALAPLEGRLERYKAELATAEKQHQGMSDTLKSKGEELGKNLEKRAAQKDKFDANARHMLAIDAATDKRNGAATSRDIARMKIGRDAGLGTMVLVGNITKAAASSGAAKFAAQAVKLGGALAGGANVVIGTAEGAYFGYKLNKVSTRAKQAELAAQEANNKQDTLTKSMAENAANENKYLKKTSTGKVAASVLGVASGVLLIAGATVASGGLALPAIALGVGIASAVGHASVAYKNHQHNKAEKNNFSDPQKALEKRVKNAMEKDEKLTRPEAEKQAKADLCKASKTCAVHFNAQSIVKGTVQDRSAAIDALKTMGLKDQYVTALEGLHKDPRLVGASDQKKEEIMNENIEAAKNIMMAKLYG